MKKARYILKWAKKIRAMNLLGGKCIGCGINNPAIMEFHHNTNEKEFNINSVRERRWSDMEKEIYSCVLLCSNCHRELHCEYDSRHSICKKELLEKFGFNGCCKCGYLGKNLASITFHHRDKKNKKFVISSVINRIIKISVLELFNEIEKCDIICENCHRLDHFDSVIFNERYDEILKKSYSQKELRKKIDRNLIADMYINKKMKQSEIANELKCASSTVCTALKEYFNK